MLIDETGGVHGIRERHVVLSAEKMPQQTAFGRELYPTIFLKAAVYARNIIMNHPFIDGNKRTGMVSAFVFLERNGYISAAKDGEIEKFALMIVKERLSLESIADWFKRYSKKLKK
jgi:death on curing protein